MKNLKTLILIFLILTYIDVNLLGQNFFSDIKQLNLGISSNLFPEANIRDAKAAIELWSKELIKDGYMDYRLVTYVFNSNEEIKDAFKKNNISIAAMRTLDYLAIKDECKIIPLLIPSNNEEVTENFIILTNKKSNISNIKQLKNKKVALQSTKPNLLSYIWFENLVMMNELTPLDEFCNITETKKDSKAIFSLFFNKIDACIVNSKIYYEMCNKNCQLKENLVIIETSPGFIRNIFCISQNLDKRHIGNLLDATVSIRSYESGKKFMDLFKFEKFTIFEEKYLKNVESLLSTNKSYHNKIAIKSKSTKSRAKN